MKKLSKIFLALAGIVTVLSTRAYADIAIEPDRQVVMYQKTQTLDPRILVGGIAVAVIVAAALIYILRKRRGK